jgi:DNA-directed RNA polymerase subunit RPC12/RpoP
MNWTDSQLETLYASVFQRRMICPTCGGEFAFDSSREIDVTGIVECRTCDARHVVSLANDPLRHTFREYTPEENRAIFTADRKRTTPVCPIDGTPMDVHLQRSFGLTSNTQIRCRRCGRKAVYVRLYG